MSTIIIRDFKLSRDFKHVDWKATLVYNHVRAFGAGIVAGILMMIFEAGGSSSIAWLAPIIWPASYLLVILPFSLLFLVLTQFIPILNIGLFVIGIWTVGLGDPIALILRKVWPFVVPVEDPPFMSPRPIIFLIKADAELNIARD